MNDLLKSIVDLNCYDKNLSSSNLYSLAIKVAIDFSQNERKMCFILPTLSQAEEFFSYLNSFLDTDKLFIFPYDDLFSSLTLGISKENIFERLKAIYSTIDDRPSIVITHASSLLLQINDVKTFKDSYFKIKVGDMFLKENFINKLINMGYQSVDEVSQINQYTTRGFIIDLFDPYYKSPIRIELFGDEIEEIRFFNVEDMLSVSKVNEITIHPCCYRLLAKDNELFNKAEKITTALVDLPDKNDNKVEYDNYVSKIDTTLNCLLKSKVLNEVDHDLFPLLFDSPSSFYSYLDDYERYTFNLKEISDAVIRSKKSEQEYFAKTLNIEGESVFLDDLNFIKSDKDLFDFNDSFIQEPVFVSNSYLESDKMLSLYLKESYKIKIVLQSNSILSYRNYLENRGIKYSIYPNISNVTLIDGKINYGFIVKEKKETYLSIGELYGISKHATKVTRFKEGKVIQKYDDLQVGDYVVHDLHGVGRYCGVTKIDNLEYLKIQYAQDQVCYIPLSQYKMIRKYSSSQGHVPSLDTMGGASWKRKKSKIRGRISYLADQLLSIYSEREKQPGFQFRRDDLLEGQFEQQFFYTHTKSQLQALKDIRDDMESPHPMDRLLSGDVGFGKTEVAFNAAFKAINSGKQVMLLAPTTLLSNQHYNVAIDRFKDYPISIECLNRFTPLQKKNEIVEGLKNGSLDFVIGTHSLLSDEIQIKNLGLLIIDEEQRFGVAHKEKIKDRYRNIDCLTLSATPIPRTMQMSLLGLRNMSLLDESPDSRIPVKVSIIQYNKYLIKEVIQKELDRNGQVYYLHNRIQDLSNIKSSLEKTFIDKKVEICHANMDKDKIEVIMDDFYKGKIDILVCTTIIESGLDIPNVNTIIVTEGDHFGLSQLYQIKGRVGRGDRQAYCYIMFDSESEMSKDAQKRLKAIKDFTELGSGYKIAMQDLNIRGAGDILGKEQKGFIDNLGYETYIELLNEVISEKKLQSEAVEKKQAVELSFSLDAYIPEEFASQSQRIQLYREVSDCNSDKEVDDLSFKIDDLYGSYPQEVANMFAKRKIEIFLNSDDVAYFKEMLGEYEMRLSESYSMLPNVIKNLESRLVRIYDILKVRLKNNQLIFNINKRRDYLSDLDFLISQIKGAKSEVEVL